MQKGKILFIGGSLNQTTMMHKISKYFNEYDCYFTPFFTDGSLDILVKNGFLDFTILAGKFKEQTDKYLSENNLNVDYKGRKNKYDLIFTCQDILIPESIKNKRIVLVQEGMTDPENLMFHLVKNLKMPRWLASTAATGLSDKYDLFFVASEGYKNLFIKKGVDPYKLKVTGIPNFDNCNEFLNNNFPYKNFVLVATSDRRETLNFENRIKFIKKAQKIADGRQLIFKLHPNENFERAITEIKRIIPEALVFTEGKIEYMIANCDVLITKYSSVVYVGIALGKEVYSGFDLKLLKELMPIQNNGQSAEIIAKITKRYLELDNYSYNTKYLKTSINNEYSYNNSN